MKTSILYFFLWIISTCAWADGKSDPGEVSLIDDFYYFVDSTKELGITEVENILSSDDFEHVESKVAHFSIEQSVVWLAFNHQSSFEDDHYLSPGNESNVWNASLYVKDSLGHYSKIFEYDHLKKDQDVRSLYFSTLAINLPPDGEDFLLRLYGQQNRNYSLVLGSRYAISKYLILRERVPVVFIGFMLCIFLYNAFLYLSTRLVVLIPYLIYLLMVTYTVPFHNGFILFSTAGMWPGEIWYTAWLIPFYVSSGVFAILYLNLKETAPYLRKIILILMLVLAVVIPVIDISQWVSLNWMAVMVPAVGLLYNVSLWVSGLYVWTNGVKHARFYVIGWIFVIASLLIYYLSTLDIIPYSHNIDFAIYFGFAAESVLFAFALGDQMNILRIEKQSMESRHLEVTTEKNRLLTQQLFMNSHLLRAPLSRVLGLLGLLKSIGSKPENQELLGHVEDATLEMDVMTRKMSAILENEGYLDQFQDDLEEVKQSIYKEVGNVDKVDN
ncbi:MAG: hypothetical protein OCD76_02625 [Reichenbachiella sp.]